MKIFFGILLIPSFWCALMSENLSVLPLVVSTNLIDAVDKISHFLAIKHPTINIISDAVAFKENIIQKDFINGLLIKSFSSSKVVIRQETSTNLAAISHQKRHSSILIIDKFQEFIEIFTKISASEFWFRGFYIVASISGEILEAETIFRLFWKIKILNVVVMIEDKNEVLVKTLMPFNSKSCQDSTSTLINKFKNGKFANGLGELFPIKMKNLHNCPVRVSIANNTDPAIFAKRLSNGSYYLSGRDIMLINALSQTLNFKINYTFIGMHVYFHENGSASGPFRSLIDGEADLSISDLWLKKDRLKFLDTTTTYINDQINFWIPPGRDLSKFEKLLFPFALHLWLTIISCLLVGGLVIFIVKLQPKPVQDLVFGAGVSYPYLNMFNAIMGGTQKIEPKKSFARFLLMMFLIYSLVIRTLYQVSFYQLIQSNKHHQEVQSIDEMIARDFKFYAYTLDIDLFQGTDAIRRR